MRVQVNEACKLLLQGDVVALPTETVYGLAAALQHEEAIAKIFAVKGRPADNPLIVHLANFQQLLPFIDELPPWLEQLADAFWPGALTVVLPARPGLVPRRVTAGLSTVAFRVPRHPQALAVIAEVGPVVMPSANLSGRPSATAAEHVENDFGSGFPVVDGGRCNMGVESTIVIYKENCWQIIRQGAIAQESLATVLGCTPAIATPQKHAKPLCPGNHYKHYSPNAKLILSTIVPTDNFQAIIGFDNRCYPESDFFISLGLLTRPEQAAEKLYAALRSLDTLGVAAAWVDMEFPLIGLFATVRERLQRAAAG